MKIGFIGFGEASYNFISGMLNEHTTDIMVYDTDLLKAKEQLNKLENGESVSVVEDISELLERTETVFVAVPGDVDESVFSLIINCKIKDKLFVDLCTALPDAKKRIQESVDKADGKYVDAAVMGSIPKLKHKVPMLISGNGIKKFEKVVDRYHMDIDVISEEAGDASIIKLCRSIYMKGLAALLIETRNVSEAYGVSDKVFASLEKSMDADKFSDYSKRLREGTIKHCRRRKEEMENCLEIIEKANVHGHMTDGTIKVYEDLIQKYD